MEKNKGLFSFRKHSVVDFLDGEKGRKRKGSRLRQSMGFLLAAALVFNTLPASGLAVSASGREVGLCEHHTKHTPDCGYMEAQPCIHEHGEECYTTVTECVHTHTDGCYPEAEETEASAGEGNATASDAEDREPENCTHQCSEESGCITKSSDCHHEHDESCGYKEAQECSYVCEICNGTESEDTGENTENTEDVGTDTAECICKVLCTEDSINGDCPVCGADDAGFLDCKGKVSEENTENQEDTGICKHHQEHDADCGYIPKSEDGEGSPCTYKCHICPVEDMIAALPDTVTEDNAADVRVQLEEILALFSELTEEEQEQIDLSRCYELQGALDVANDPMPLATGNVVLTYVGQEISFTVDECGNNCQGHTITQNVQGGVVQDATILVESGTHNITFSGLNLSFAAVGIMPGGTMNLTLGGTNKIVGSNCGFYVPVGATLVITEQSTGSLDISLGSYATAAGIGGAYYDPNGNDGDFSCGMVVINGGTITAAGRDYSAGIGGASYAPNFGNGGNITISGGHVTATGSDGAPGIGGGKDADSDGSLTLSSADVLYNSTTLGSKGKYTINGVPTEDMISVPADMHYISADMAAEIAGKVTLSGGVEVCGKIFKINTEGWNLEVTKKSDLEYIAAYTHADKGTVSKSVIILPCIHNNGAALTHHEGKAADCTQTGVKEYWDCSVCGKKFSDKDGQTEITNTEIPIAAHVLTHHERNEADCTQAGVVEYWDCSVCRKKFSDKDGQIEISDANTVIPVKSHTLTHHAGVEAGCLTEGNIEYWSCSVCSKLFSDADGKIEVTDIKTPAKGHDYVAWESNGNGTHTHSCQTPGCGFTETGDCSGGTATYTEKAKCEICEGEYGERLKDTGAPTGEISIGTNKWNSFLNMITFGLFFKKTEQVTITAADNESGVASVSYYISDSKLTEEEVKVLDNWTAENTDKTTFNISPDKSCVVYAKITDNQGNVTYISSNGLVFDGTSPSITGIADGETYCTSQEVTVTDNNSESVTVTVNGKEQTLSDGKFTLDVKSDTATIVIAAEDIAGNVITVTVYAGHNYGTDWKSDSNGHWQECVVCGNKSEVLAHTEDSGTVTKPATQTETGIRTYKCSICGCEMRTEIIEKLPESHKHSYGTEWKSDSNNHWHECDCGAKNSIAAHTWDSGTITVQPTTDREGEKTFTCTVCGRTKTESVGKLPQSHTESSQPGDKKPDNSNQQNNGNTEDTKVDTGIPFIKDEDGKNGWNVIRTEEEKAEEGSIINVDMNGSTVVPGDIFDSIKGRDITITFDMGNGIIWSVNGKSITTDKADDINFSIKTGTNAIPVDIVNNITGERYSIQLSLSHEGEFGFTAILSINLGKDNAGLTANLYYYNESTGELEFICADTVAEDGMVSLAFTHASDYAVVIDADSMEQETGAGSTAEAPKTGEESTSADTTDTSVKNDLWNRIWVFVLCGVLVVAGLGIFFVGRKKNSKG